MKFDKLMAKVRRMAPLAGTLDSPDREAAKRRRSLVLAREMRKRGWLAAEGYAPGSWASRK